MYSIWLALGLGGAFQGTITPPFPRAARAMAIAGPTPCSTLLSALRVKGSLVPWFAHTIPKHSMSAQTTPPIRQPCPVWSPGHMGPPWEFRSETSHIAPGVSFGTQCEAARGHAHSRSHGHGGWGPRVEGAASRNLKLVRGILLGVQSRGHHDCAALRADEGV